MCRLEEWLCNKWKGTAEEGTWMELIGENHPKVLWPCTHNATGKGPIQTLKSSTIHVSRCKRWAQLQHPRNTSQIISKHYWYVSDTQEGAAEIWNFKEKNKDSVSFQKIDYCFLTFNSRFLISESGNTKNCNLQYQELQYPFKQVSSTYYLVFPQPCSFCFPSSLVHFAHCINFEALLGNSDILLCPWKWSLTPWRGQAFLALKKSQPKGEKAERISLIIQLNQIENLRVGLSHYYRILRSTRAEMRLLWEGETRSYNQKQTGISAGSGKHRKSSTRTIQSQLKSVFPSTVSFGLSTPRHFCQSE